jgi:ABC-type multidrug transport system ATPase subunit
LSPILTREVGAIIGKIAEEGVSILLIEQNANLALQLARKCYVLETGTITLEGASADLQNNEHVKEAYLGLCPTSDMPLTATVNGHKKGVKSPQERTAEPQNVGRDNMRTHALETESLPETTGSNVNHVAEAQVKEAIRPKKFQFDLGLSPRSGPNGLVSGKQTGNEKPRYEGRSATTKEDRFSRTKRNSSKKPSPRVVQKVFTPKQR